MSLYSNKNTPPAHSATEQARDDVRRLWEQLYRERGDDIADRVLVAIHEQFENLQCRGHGTRISHPRNSDIWSASVLRAERVTLIYRWIVPQQPASTKWTKHTGSYGIHLEPPRSPKLPERYILLRAVLTPKDTGCPSIDLTSSLSQSVDGPHGSISPYYLLPDLHKKHGIDSNYSNPPPAPPQSEGCLRFVIGVVVVCFLLWLTTLMPILIVPELIALWFWLRRMDREETENKMRNREGLFQAIESDAQRRKDWPDFLDSPKPPNYK